MTIKLLQFSCKGVAGVDPRQGEAVLRHRPDVIIFEAPTNLRPPDTVFNQYPTNKKPLDKVRDHIKNLEQVGKTYPWVRSDIQVYKNIVGLWNEGHDIKIYNVDAPSDILRVPDDQPSPNSPHPPRRGQALFFWVRIYLREKIMAQHMSSILKKYENQNITILIFLQKFHWLNVQFQLSKPSKREIWKYYFGRFNNLNPEKLETKIKEYNSTLFKYWERFSDF